MTILRPTPSRHAVGCACGMYVPSLSPIAAEVIDRMHTSCCGLAHRKRLPDRTPIDTELLQPGN